MNEEKTIINERPDSIKISKNASGKYTYEIKRYFDATKNTPELVIAAMKKTEQEIQKQIIREDTE